jgi:hypothetical protein
MEYISMQNMQFKATIAQRHQITSQAVSGNLGISTDLNSARLSFCRADSEMGFKAHSLILVSFSIISKPYQLKFMRVKKGVQATKEGQPQCSQPSSRRKKVPSQTCAQDPSINTSMQKTINDWEANPELYSNIREAASKNGFKFKIFYNCVTRQAKAAQDAHACQQAIPLVEEQEIADWTLFLALTGHAQSKANILRKAEEVASRKLGKHWLPQFLMYHPEIRLAQPTSLDPKCAQAFNYTTMNDHFKKLDVLMKLYSLEWYNVYNMDEKGIQAGGGRNSLSKKLLFSRTQHI